MSLPNYKSAYPGLRTCWQQRTRRRIALLLIRLGLGSAKLAERLARRIDPTLPVDGSTLPPEGQ
jgi:hypothetical protein